MAILTKQPRKQVIDLTGPAGNAFCLMGTAMKLCKELDLDKDKVLSEMQSSDYENAIQIFDKYFGYLITWASVPLAIQWIVGSKQLINSIKYWVLPFFLFSIYLSFILILFLIIFL